MCGGGGHTTTVAAADPAPVNVTNAGDSQSAARIESKKAKQRRGISGNTLSTDRSILSGALSQDNLVRNYLG